MKLKYTLAALVFALSAGMTTAAEPARPAAAAQKVLQKSFASPEEAGAALAQALRAQDMPALLAVLGPASASWLSSGDETADRADRAKFLSAYEAKHAFKPLAEKKALLLIGEGDWEFPAPIVQRASGWVFDASAGREEIINRRIGRNELETIQTLLAIVDAQREYAVGDLDGNGYNDYAQRVISSEGKRDGLFWPVQAGATPSPLGPLLAAAASQGYARSKDAGQPAPYHGYRFRLLKAQGAKAVGGAYSYLAGDKMIGGFAAVAYPAKYGSSGVMTFIVNHDGTVYQKNLGKKSESIALKMPTFNPDAGWRKVE